MFYVLKRMLSLSVMVSLVCVPFVHADVNADLKEVRSFQLTEKKLDQFTQALRNMAEAVEKNPELAKQDNSLGSNASINDMVAAFDKIPPIKNAVETAGLSTREFVLFQMALMSAAMGHYLVKQGQKLPPEFSAEHATFYKQHEEKFKALEKEWKAIDKKMDAMDNEEDEEEEESDE
jgi:type I restriction-modification system DNA methylase subunit